MGIAILNELQNRLYTLAIAGTNLLAEDFRLKKTAEQFHAVAASSPVLSKIDKLVQQLLEEDNKEKEISLMEAITLVDAVVCTQAEYVVKKEGKQEIPVLKGGKITNTKYSELHPLITALTTKGSGRYEVLSDAYEEKKEILKDFHILPLLIKGFNDSYNEIPYLIEEILIKQVGEDAIFLCKEDFDPMGGKDMVNRLHVLKELAGEKENDFYISLLENSSPVVKEAAILNLGCSPANADLLIHLAETERGKKYKTAALKAMEQLNEKKNIDYLLTKAQKNPETYLPYLKNCETEEISDVFADALEKILQELLQVKKEEKIPDKLHKKIRDVLISSAMYKCSEKMIDVFQKYGDTNWYIHQINWIMICNMLDKTDEKYIHMTKELYQRCRKVYLPSMLVAEFLTEPEKTYDLCMPYFQDFHDKAFVAEICMVLRLIKYDKIGYYIKHSEEQAARFIAKEIDIRWIESLTQVQENIWNTRYRGYGDEVYWILRGWVNCYCKEAVPFFRRKFRQFVGMGFFDLDILEELGETNFKTLVASYIRSRNYFYYDFSKTIDFLRKLPFTEEERAEEAKMILEGFEKRRPNSKDSLDIRFKEELKEIITQGKEG